MAERLGCISRGHHCFASQLSGPLVLLHVILMFSSPHFLFISPALLK